MSFKETGVYRLGCSSTINHMLRRDKALCSILSTHIHTKPHHLYRIMVALQPAVLWPKGSKIAKFVPRVKRLLHVNLESSYLCYFLSRIIWPQRPPCLRTSLQAMSWVIWTTLPVMLILWNPSTQLNLLFSVLGGKPKVLWMLGKHSTTDLFLYAPTPF